MRIAPYQNWKYASNPDLDGTTVTCSFAAKPLINPSCLLSRFYGTAHELFQSWGGYFICVKTVLFSLTTCSYGFSQSQTFIHSFGHLFFHIWGVTGMNFLLHCCSWKSKSKVQSLLCKHNIMCAPINCFLWYFISRAVLVDRVSELYPPAEETLKEKKLREAFSNCLAPDGTFRSRTHKVRNSFLGSSLVVTSAPLQLFFQMLHKWVLV